MHLTNLYNFNLYTKFISLKLDADANAHLQWVSAEFGVEPKHIFKSDSIGFCTYMLYDVSEKSIKKIKQRAEVESVSLI